MTDLTQPARNSLREIKAYLATPWTVTLLVPVLVFIGDRLNFVPIIQFAVSALLSTLPYIIFAVFSIAYLKATGAEALVARAFQGRENKMIVLAALFGGLAPFCSCEVIPFVAGLLALGAPLSAVMAFWLSSPLIDPPSFLITASALGWSFAIGKALAAIGLGLFGGITIKLLMHTGWLSNPLRDRKSGSGCGASPFTGKPEWRYWQHAHRRETFNSELITNGLFLLKWMALAYVLEALLVTYIPADLIVKIVGVEGVVPIAIAALVGMPAYLNSYVAPPLLAGLINQGMSSGAAMSFMVAGAVSSVPAMAAVWSLVMPRVFALYLGLGISGAVIAGIVFQLLI